MFHLSLPCQDLSETKAFYTGSLGFSRGRSSSNWCDIDFGGNQITFIQTGPVSFPSKHYNFEGSILPSFHFGILLERQDWQDALSRCQEAGVVNIGPISFLQDKVGAHESFFVEDPTGYLVEFKCFLEKSETFQK